MISRRYSFYQVLVFLFIVIFMAGCASNSESEQLKDDVTQSLTPTESPPTLTVTDIPPTRTDTPEPTLPSTSTPTDTPTDTPTITPSFTPEPAMLTLLNDSACMNGAGFEHHIHHYVLSGMEYSILGRLSDQSWWLVGTEDEQSCWVYAEYTAVSGNIELLPVLTPPPIPSLTPTVTPETPGIYYILIAKDTGGTFGCGDSLIRYYPGVWVKGDMEDDITGALNALFANHREYTNGLYNPIYKSDIKAKSVEETGGDVVVQLAGNFVRPKDTCESKRMREQIWYTVSQFSHVRAVIYMNNALLGDLLVIAK